jgi:hypothetical protein
MAGITYRDARDAIVIYRVMTSARRKGVGSCLRSKND